MNRSDEWKELLILQVQKYACLYDSTKESYRNKHIRENAWSEISKICECSVSVNQRKFEDYSRKKLSSESEVASHDFSYELQKVWKNLRTKFKRERERLENSKSGDSFTPQRKWNLYEVMAFIKQHSHYRHTSSNMVELDSGKPDLRQILEDEFVVEDMPCCSNMVPASDRSCSASESTATTISEPLIHSSPEIAEKASPKLISAKRSRSSAKTTTSKKRNKQFMRTQSEDEENIATSKLISFLDSTKAKENTNDPTLQFFFSMAQEAQKLPEEIRLRLQLNIMQAILSASEEAKAAPSLT